MFNPGDRVRYIHHEWVPDLAEFGTVESVESNGNVWVDWDGEGPGIHPHNPSVLARVK
jgi:hypothetical protein